MQLKHDVFISYARKNSDFAEPFYQALKAAGLEVWMDRDNIRSGAKWKREIQEGIYYSRLIVVLVSQASMESPWVIKELDFADEQDKHFLPVEIQPLNLEEGTFKHISLSGLHYLSANSSSQNSDFIKLADAIKQEVNASKSRELVRVKTSAVATIAPDDKGLTTGVNSKNATLQQVLTSRGRRESRLFKAIREGATDVESTDKSGQTALHYAALNSEPDVISLLLERGANINVRDNSGISPLHLAVENVSLVRWLLLKGADYQAKAKNGLTALNYAHESKETQTIQLLELWADVKKGRMTANKALRAALDLSTHKANKILNAVAAGADDTTMSDIGGRTALHWAAQENEPELIQLLLDKGADVKAKDKAQNTPLMLARQKGCTDAEEVLRSSKASQIQTVTQVTSGRSSAPTPPQESEAELPAVNPNNQLETALMSRGRYKADNVLGAIRGGVTDFSFTDQSGRTALHWAAMKNDVEAARIALAGGADASAVSNLEQTALDLARENGSAEVFALLGAPAKAAAPNPKQPPQTQPAHDVYIVCSPLNQYFAEQLETSLKRAGIKVSSALGEVQTSTALSNSRLMLLVASAPTLRLLAAQNAIEHAQQSDIPIVVGRIDSNPKSHPAQLENAIWVDEKRDQSSENLMAITSAVQAELDKINAASTRQTSVGEGNNWYSVNGVIKLRSSIASKIVLSALRELARLAPQFLAEVETQVLAQAGNRVLKRRWIARSKEELYANPEFRKHSVEIVSGWWLGTNYSNDAKREMLEVAREVAVKLGIQFDFELV